MTKYRIVETYRHQSPITPVKDLRKGYVIQWFVDFTIVSSGVNQPNGMWKDLWNMSYEKLEDATKALKEHKEREDLENTPDEVVLEM